MGMAETMKPAQLTLDGREVAPEIRRGANNPLAATRVYYVGQTRKYGALKDNPCRKVYGPGPEGKRCKTCALLCGHKTRRTYYKCKLRGCTAGLGTDHRVNWPACGKYEEATSQE